MNPEVSPPPQRKSLVKRGLPYLVIAAIVINSGLLFVALDYIWIFTNGIAAAFEMEAGFTPQRAAYLVGRYDLRTYANLALIAMLALLTLRDFQEKNETNAAR